MMVKVSAYRLKYIHLQIYNFHLEEAAFLNKITGTPNSSKGGFPYSSNKKMYQIPRPHDSRTTQKNTTFCYDHWGLNDHVC